MASDPKESLQKALKLAAIAMKYCNEAFARSAPPTLGMASVPFFDGQIKSAEAMEAFCAQVELTVRKAEAKAAGHEFLMH
jgi:hypothetical protein